MTNLDTPNTPHAPIPFNGPGDVTLIEWPGPGDAPGRLARARQWFYEHTPQLIILATAALAVVAALVIVAVVEVAP